MFNCLKTVRLNSGSLCYVGFVWLLTCALNSTNPVIPRLHMGKKRVIRAVGPRFHHSKKYNFSGLKVVQEFFFDGGGGAKIFRKETWWNNTPPARCPTPPSLWNFIVDTLQNRLCNIQYYLFWERCIISIYKHIYRTFVDIIHDTYCALYFCFIIYYIKYDLLYLKCYILYYVVCNFLISYFFVILHIKFNFIYYTVY